MEGLKDGLSNHELDAVTCALVGKLFVEGKSVTYGAPEQGIVMPKGEKSGIKTKAKKKPVYGHK